MLASCDGVRVQNDVSGSNSGSRRRETLQQLMQDAQALCYILFLKRLVLVDCITLGGLYMLRIVAGRSAMGLPPSFWLLFLYPLPLPRHA